MNAQATAEQAETYAREAEQELAKVDDLDPDDYGKVLVFAQAAGRRARMAHEAVDQVLETGIDGEDAARVCRAAARAARAAAALYALADANAEAMATLFES